MSGPWQRWRFLAMAMVVLSSLAWAGCAGRLLTPGPEAVPEVKGASTQIAVSTSKTPAPAASPTAPAAPAPTESAVGAPTPTSTQAEAPGSAISPTAIPTVAPASAQTSPSPLPSATPASAGPTPAADLEGKIKEMIAFLNADAKNRAGLARWIEGQGLKPGQPKDYGETQHALGEPVEADLDGDGSPEIVLSLWQQSESVLPVGAILVLRQQGGQYTIAYQASRHPISDDDLYSPALLRVEDINADRVVEVVYTSTNCGAHTCFLTVWGIAWQGSGYGSIFAQPPEMAYPDLAIKDTDGDGKQEIVLRGGVMGSVGAGLQRERAEIHAWRTDRYELVSTTYEPSPYLYFRVIDANAALAKGDYTQAIALYRQAIQDNSLLTWKQMLAEDASKEAEIARQERDGLRAFALFRLVQAQGFAEDEAGAKASLAELDQRYPASALGKAAGQYWQQFRASHDAAAACAAVQPVIEAHPEVLEPLNGYGYANQDFAAQDICYQPAATHDVSPAP